MKSNLLVIRMGPVEEKLVLTSRMIRVIRKAFAVVNNTYLKRRNEKEKVSLRVKVGFALEASFSQANSKG